MMYDIVDKFEKEVADYAGSKYGVAVDSCSSAITLSCLRKNIKEAFIPKRTYVSVPNAIINAGAAVKFYDKKWQGVYELFPCEIFDSALRFTCGMFSEFSRNNGLYCLSFHYKKHIPIGKGGMILTDCCADYNWLKKARWNGRSPAYNNVKQRGMNAYMLPEQAARGLYLLGYLDEHNPDIIEQYDDLSLYTDHKGNSLFEDL